jgi:hypothetical protein
MRTKTLLLAAALSAAGLATSLAQSNVYSLNVVGYINITATNDLILLANQLDLDGTGVNNTLESVLGSGQGGTPYPNNTRVFGFNANNGQYVQALNVAGVWIAGAGKEFVRTNSMQPGQGFFFSKPVGGAGPTQLTLVGNVLQGQLVNTPFVGVSLTSSKVPQAGGVETVLGLSLPNVATAQNTYRFNAGTGAYQQNLKINGAWAGGLEPSMNVGESFFLRAAANAAWTRNFTVQ